MLEIGFSCTWFEWEFNDGKEDDGWVDNWLLELATNADGVGDGLLL